MPAFKTEKQLRNPGVLRSKRPQQLLLICVEQNISALSVKAVVEPVFVYINLPPLGHNCVLTTPLVHHQAHREPPDLDFALLGVVMYYLRCGKQSGLPGGLVSRN